MKSETQVILFDVTYLEKMSTFTGIERVMVDTLDFFENEESFHIIYVRLKNRRLIEVGKKEMDRISKEIKFSSRSKKLRKRTKLKFQILTQRFIKPINCFRTYNRYQIDRMLLQEIQK